MSQADRQREALERVAEHDPELAARLVLMSLPAAAASIPATLGFELDVDGVGAYHVSVADGRARVDPATNGRPRGRYRSLMRIIDDAITRDARAAPYPAAVRFYPSRAREYLSA